MFRRARVLLAAGCVALLAPGCHWVYQATRAASAPTTAFLPDPGRLQELPPEAVFQRRWVAPGVAWNRYRKIVIAPVSTAYLLPQTRWDRQNYAERFGCYAEDCRRMADYLRTVFRDSLAADPRHRFEVADAPAPDALRLELALVELVPAKPGLNVVEQATELVLPVVAGTAMSPLTILNGGSIAIEGKVVDSQTGALLLMFAGRERAESAVVDLAGFTSYGQNRAIIRTWGRELVTMVNAHQQPVKRKLPFTLISW